MTMLTKIGNSHGIRIPKAIIKQSQLENCEIEFEVTKNGLLLKPIIKKNRDSWSEDIDGFNKTSLQDEAILDDVLNLENDDEEWTW